MENIPGNEWAGRLFSALPPFHFLAHVIDIYSWKLLLSAEIETPQDFQGRNVSVSADSNLSEEGR